jgi:hypothetical protein
MEEWPTSSETTIIYLPLREPKQYNRPFSTGQLSVFIIQTLNWDVATRSERKNKKSCNKNAIKNTEMFEKYIYIAFQSNK